MLNPKLTFLAAAAVTMIGLAGTGALAAVVPDRAGGEKLGVARGGIHIHADYPFRFRLPSGKLVPMERLAKRRPPNRLRLFADEPGG